MARSAEGSARALDIGSGAELLRPGVLEGVSVLVAAAPGGPLDGASGAAVAEARAGLGPAAADARAGLGPAVAEACAALGANVSTLWPISDRSDVAGEVALDAAGEVALDAADETVLDAAVAAVVGESGRIDLLAVDGAGLFACGLARGGDGRAALRACTDAAWNATRAVVNGAFLSAAKDGGRIVYLAPAPDAGAHAGAACAGLENLARTLSIEWARHGITAVTIAPGTRTAAREAAALTAYLATPAGAYFSGCLFDLRGPDAGP